MSSERGVVGDQWARSEPDAASDQWARSEEW
jgi:hypothetical protein